MPDSPLILRRLHAVKRRAPRMYWRVRSGIALAAWFLARARRRLGRRETFDEAFWQRHEVGDWDAAARTIVDLFNPRSVVDVGCGHGLLLSALARVRPELRLIGLDESTAALARARARGVPVRAFDVAGASGDRVASLVTELGACDLVVCLEVAEHLPPWHAGKLLRLLVLAPRVVFSAAHPNQGGHLHVNERPAEYWRARFETLSYEVSPLDGEFRRRLAQLDLPPWYAANAHVFDRIGSHV